MSTELKIVRFRGALYRLATQPDIRELWQKREKMLELVRSLGVQSAAEEYSFKEYHTEEEPPEAPFLQLKDKRSFIDLVYELANRASQTGYGETPAFFDRSADELQAGIQDALTGKLIPTLKQVRQLFDELKQHPEVLHPRYRVKEAPKRLVEPKKVHIPSQKERELELKLQQKWLEEHPKTGSTLPSIIRFRGALYRRAEIAPLSVALKSLVVGDPGDKNKPYLRSIIRKLRENLLRFSTSFREDALVAAERSAQELLSISESAAVLLAKIVSEERELRKDVASGRLQERKYYESRQRSGLIRSFLRLKKKGLIDNDHLKSFGYPVDLDPTTLAMDKLEDLLESPLEEERDDMERERLRRENFGLPPQPKRKIWKESPKTTVEAPKTPKGRPRLTNQSPKPKRKPKLLFPLT